MYFNKYSFSRNFSYSHAYSPAQGFQFKQAYRVAKLSQYGANIFRITVKGADWDHNHSQAELNLPEAVNPDYNLKLSETGEISLETKSGAPLLQAFSNGCFGKNGAASIFRFQYNPTDRFYGAGSKLMPLELSGIQTKFWNTDVWGDFPMEQVVTGRPDPYYVSIPYLIIHTEYGWVGLLYNNPSATFLSIGAQQGIETFAKIKTDDAQSVCIGAESGQPDLFIIAADSLAELTRTYQKMVGVTPLPPIWSLGYQQCRWGYESVCQLQALKDKFEETSIPVDGLWLDIDYMDGYRVFTTDPAKIPEPSSEFNAMLNAGHPVVPIIDPGVKLDPEYSVYQSGCDADIFCKNPEGEDFVGLVWPGMTVFPDFSREAGREWWAEQVEAFAKQGIVGAWLDMNDPSLGKANPYDMRWGADGEFPHETFHNQYGAGMAKATRAGFQSAHPDRRIFLLTRSNYTAGGKYAAVWTGDNVANYHYLRMSIPTSLNLALSGIPFNGGDVGGFGYDTNPKLLRDWTKAACLGAFFRNHSDCHSIRQEPWCFDALTLEVCRNFIQLRYRLMPYLYNLFIQQEATGEAIMRPLIYDFESTPELEIDRIDDAYLTGPSILQAPFVDESNETRPVALPGTQSWYAPFENLWYTGNQTLADVKRDDQTSPIYLREGSIVPLRRGDTASHVTNLKEIDLLIVAKKDSEIESRDTYVADDGNSLAYQRGERSQLKITVSAADGQLNVCVEQTEDGFGMIEYRLMLLADFDSVKLNGTEMLTHSDVVLFAGHTLPVFAG